MKTTKKDALAELQKEMYMRRKVWKMADRKNEKFYNSEHQKRYDTLREVHDTIAAITPKEWHEFQQRIERKKQELEQQKSLF